MDIVGAGVANREDDRALGCEAEAAAEEDDEEEEEEEEEEEDEEEEEEPSTFQKKLPAGERPVNSAGALKEKRMEEHEKERERKN